MSSKIRIKSAQTTSSPSGILDRGELAFSYANKKLWIGNVNGASNAEIQIGGEITASSADITTSSIKIPTGKAVYDYVSSLGSSGSLNVSGDTGSVNILLGSETLGIVGGDGLTSSGSGNNITLDVDSTVVRTTGTQTIGGNKTFSNNVSIGGNLTVTGTTTTVNSTIVTIQDPIFVLGSDTVEDTYDRGIAFKYKLSTTNYEGFFGWDRSNDVFVFRKPGIENDESDGTSSGSIGNAYFNDIYFGTDDAIGVDTSYISNIDGLTLASPANTGGIYLLSGNEIVLQAANNSAISFSTIGLVNFSIDFQTYVDGNTGDLFVGNSDHSSSISVYGNIESLNAGVSEINGFIIDGGSF